jgi:hypothetical protein
LVSGRYLAPLCLKTVFLGTEMSEDTELECYMNSSNEIWIHIQHPDYSSMGITLDKSTAIKFAKTLRTEINKIQGVNNG